MNNYSKKLTAQLLLCSLLLESCYNPNLGTSKKNLPAPAPPTYQQHQYEQGAHDKPSQRQAAVRSQDQPRATGKPLPTTSSAPSASQQVAKKQPTSPQQTPSIRTLSVRNQHKLLLSQRAAQAKRHREAVLEEASQPTQPSQLRPAILPPPPRPTSSPSSEDKAPLGTLSPTYLAQGGHQVTFIQQDGQGWACVNEHLPIGFTRRIDLPVYCEPGLCVAAVGGYDTTWHKHRIHVCFPEKSPAQRGYVYVGTMGLKGGGGGDRPNCGKWTGDWIPDGCGGRGCWGHPPNRHSSRSSSQSQNAALGGSSSRDWDDGIDSWECIDDECDDSRLLELQEELAHAEEEYEREWIFRDRMEEIQKEFGEKTHISNIQQARQIKARLQEHLDFLQELGPVTRAQEGNLRMLRQCYADADSIEQAYVDAERYQRFRKDLERSLQQDCDELNRLQDAKAEPAVIIAKAEAIKLHVQAAIESVEQYSTRQSKEGALTSLREAQQKLDEIIKSFTKRKLLLAKYKEAFYSAGQEILKLMAEQKAAISKHVDYEVSKMTAKITPKARKYSAQEFEEIFPDINSDQFDLQKFLNTIEIEVQLQGATSSAQSAEQQEKQACEEALKVQEEESLEEKLAHLSLDQGAEEASQLSLSASSQATKPLPSVLSLQTQDPTAPSSPPSPQLPDASAAAEAVKHYLQANQSGASTAPQQAQGVALLQAVEALKKETKRRYRDTNKTFVVSDVSEHVWADLMQQQAAHRQELATLRNLRGQLQQALASEAASSSDDEQLYSRQALKEKQAFAQGIGEALQGRIEGLVDMLRDPQATVESYVALLSAIPALPSIIENYVNEFLYELDEEARAERLGQLLTEAVLLLVPSPNLLDLAGISKKLGKAAERMGKFSLKNVKLLNEAFLKQHGISAHALKSPWVGESNMAKFNIYRHTQTGELILLQHKGKGVPIPTGKFIN